MDFFSLSMKESLRLIATPGMLQLLPSFFYIGLNITFHYVYCSCIGFTGHFDDAKSLTGLHGIVLGIGGLTGGLVFGIFGYLTNRLGHSPIVALGSLAHVTAYSLIYVNLPRDSPFGYTESEAILEPPSPVLAMACSLMIGIGDACFNTQIQALLGKVRLLAA